MFRNKLSVSSRVKKSKKSTGFTPFWDITQRRVVIPYRSFGSESREVDKELQDYLVLLTLDDGTDRLSRNVGKGVTTLRCVVGPAGRSARPRTQHDYHHDTKVKPEAATAVIELLMMGGKTSETC